MKNLLAALLFALFLVPLNVYAAKQCYSGAEAEADQGIRIKSELMVIGLNCQHMGKRYGQDLYGDYRKFSNDNADIFTKYESILMAFYKKNGLPDPDAKLKDLHTSYANKISHDAATMRPDIFCAKYAKRIEQAKAMKKEDFRKWAAMIFPAHPVSYPLCSG